LHKYGTEGKVPEYLILWAREEAESGEKPGKMPENLEEEQTNGWAKSS
jgi:hypothetical protein